MFSHQHIARPYLINLRAKTSRIRLKREGILLLRYVQVVQNVDGIETRRNQGENALVLLSCLLIVCQNKFYQQKMDLLYTMEITGITDILSRPQYSICT